MITIKLELTEKLNLNYYLNQYNNIVRFAYNRFQEKKRIVKLIK